MATKTIVQRDETKISNQIENYRAAISKVNTLIKAFTDAGYTIDDKQANEFCQKNFKSTGRKSQAAITSTALYFWRE